MVTLTIDGITVEVPEGTTVLRAAEKAGVKIPTLCDHPHLTPFGGCRLCIVEVQGFRVPIASCTLPASQGMVVQTNTDKLRASRKFILSMLFSERNHFCPFCQLSGGDCELQNAAYAEGMTHWLIQPNWNTYAVDTSHPYFVLDHNRCIMCQRCVRACGEITGNFTLSVAERGSASILVADCNTPLGKSTCVSCGNCVQACPTGALIDRQSAYHGLEKRLERKQTVCVGCSVGCGIDALVADNQLIRLEGNWNAPVNKGAMCKTGRFETPAENRARLRAPLLRKDGKLEPVTWEEALDAVAAHLKPLAGQPGSGVAALVSSRLPAESLSLFKQLFANGLSSDMVTSTEEGWPTRLPAELAEQTGAAFEANLDAVRSADCVMVIGADLVEHHQVAGFFVKRALPKGVRLIVVDPQENGMDDLAAHTLKAPAGSDVEVLRAMQAAALKAGLAKNAGTIADVEATLAAAPAATGLALEAIAGAAQMLAAAVNPVILYGKNLTAPAGETQAAALKELVALARTVGAGVLSVKGKANSLAVSQYGLDRPFELNGHQAAYVALGDDEPSKRLVKRLEKAPFRVVQASHVSPLTEAADVVLPVTNWAEQEGHYLNLEGRLQAARQLLQAPQNVWANDQVFTALAGRLGVALQSNWKEQLFQRVSPVAMIEN